MKIAWKSSRWYDIEGYLGRIVKHDDGSMKTILQHREVMESHLGRSLASNEVVHHKNSDRKDNRIANLEVMTREEHAAHHAPEVEMICFMCPQCGRKAEKEARNVRHNKKQGRAGPFCGRSCAGKWSRKHASVGE